jgi:hypothetical protein
MTTLMIKDLPLTEEYPLTPAQLDTIHGGRCTLPWTPSAAIDAAYESALKSGANMMEFHINYMTAHGCSL